MTGALVGLGVVAVVIAAVLLFSRVKQPANLDEQSRSNIHDHAADPGESQQLYQGADRPAGPDAEDPPTTVPNRRDVQPPGDATQR